MAMHATPPALVAPVSPRPAHRFGPMQVDPDTAALTAQPYLRAIHWVASPAPVNVPIVAVLDTGVTSTAAGLQGRWPGADLRAGVGGGYPVRGVAQRQGHQPQRAGRGFLED